MEKTLKTLINTGLFMLCFSHSHGLAMVYNLNDAVNKTGGTFTTLLDTNTHPGFNGIDDTFDGSVTFNFTITFDQYPSSGNEYALFMLNDGQGPFKVAIGAYYSNNWSGFQEMDNNSSLNLGTNPILEGQSQAFTLTIDFNAGALDTGTVVLAGDPTAYNLAAYDYSFDGVHFETAFPSTSGKVVGATDMSVSIVPEPATYAFLSGALALVFVAVRRRFTA